jgi:hypothetical protein
VTVSIRTTRFTWQAIALVGGVLITRKDAEGRTATLGVPYQPPGALHLFVPSAGACDAMELSGDVLVDLNVALAEGRSQATA